jgi:hypothetical protein
VYERRELVEQRERVLPHAFVRRMVAPYSCSILNNVCIAPIRTTGRASAQRQNLEEEVHPERAASPVSHQKSPRKGFQSPSERYACLFAPRTAQAY